MKLYSTRNQEHLVGLREALMRSMPPDGGLYMPASIPVLEKGKLEGMRGKNFRENAYTVLRALLEDEVDPGSLETIIGEAFDFPVTLVELESRQHVLELFHGPSLAFKDFGARFMSRLMQYFRKDDPGDIQILVATSGDTGGAVAQGFSDLSGIRVTILYPSGRVSPLQRRQMTTASGNIRVLEVDGNFDDCQLLAKQAFGDQLLNGKIRLCSANSINIARLIAQICYYFQAWACLEDPSRELFISVPSGNFGNLTAGLIARRMGLPVKRFIASTNINDVVPAYLSSGHYQPRDSEPTISSAMDVGAPSNFERIMNLYQGDLRQVRDAVEGYRFTDAQTRSAIRDLYVRYGYIACPHTAVAWLGLRQFLSGYRPGNYSGILLSTAHPAKFPEVYDADIRDRITVPSRVNGTLERPERFHRIAVDYSRLRHILMEHPERTPIG